jgi:glucan phosphorylase
MEGGCKYTELAVADSRKGVVLQLGGLSEVLTTPHSKIVPVTNGIHVPWVWPGSAVLYDLSNGKEHEIWYL